MRFKLDEKEPHMIQRYLRAAMLKAQFKKIENPEPVFGTIPGCAGAWATGKTEEECRRALEEVLEEWVLLGVRMGHALPEIDGIRIEAR